MEQNQNQNQNQSNRSGDQGEKGNTNTNNEQIQHRSDVIKNNTENGNDNPQDGEEWSNYRNRSLSANSENQQNKQQ